MSQKEGFEYPEDYYLFGILVANGMCAFEDAEHLVRLQRSITSSSRRLHQVIGGPGREVDKVGRALRSNVTPSTREGLQKQFPLLPKVLEMARELAAPVQASSMPVNGQLPVSMEEFLQPLIQELRPLVEELRDKRVELGNMGRKLDYWGEAAIQFLGSVESLEKNPDLDETWRSAAISLRKQFSRTFAPLGFILIAPERGEPLDETQHMVEDVDQTFQDLPPSVVIECTEWGYRLSGDRIIQAKVIATPERKD